jgi:hypothetical protein
MKKIGKRGERLLLDPGLVYFRGTPFRMRDCSPRELSVIPLSFHLLIGK